MNQFDPRLEALFADVAELKRQMGENTAITVQVRDILASFRIIGKIAKWVTAVGAAATAIYHTFSFLRHLKG